MQCFGGFVFCLFVVLCFWHTFAVSNVFLRVPNTELDFAAPSKLSVRIIGINIKICTTTPRTTTEIVNVKIVFFSCYFYLVVTL